VSPWRTRERSPRRAGHRVDKDGEAPACPCPTGRGHGDDLRSRPQDGRRRLQDPPRSVEAGNPVAATLREPCGSHRAAPRRGELLALRWRDVALDRRVDGESAPLLRVTASLQRIDGQDVFLSPKTDRARRTVGLPPAAVALLRRHRREQLERRVLLGEAWTDLDLVSTEAMANRSPRIRSSGIGTASLTGSVCPISGSMICVMHSRRGCSRPRSTQRSLARRSVTPR
jgi:hypothetical protein